MIRESLEGLKILRSYRQLLSTIKSRVPSPDIELIKKAFKFANRAHREQKRLSGEPYIIHPLAVAQILAEQRLDCQTIAAALLHDVVEDTAFIADDIGKIFGDEINKLVKSVTKISSVKNKGTGKNAKEANLRLKERESAENIRLMLLATASDVRVILIKLADKLHNMRTLQFQKPEKIERIASEVLYIYAPIAGRLGMFRIKSELEDLAFFCLHPDDFSQVNETLRQTRSERDDFITTVRKILKQRLKEINIEARVEGRAKHIFSIYKKMKKYDKRFEEIYDLRGIRIILNDIRDCYGALGIVHTLWPPIPGRFKDYIATPKVNGYQSLHTTVVGPDARPLEIQIRTVEMEEMADHGIAAHWLYKSDTGIPDAARLRWLKRLSRITEISDDTGDFIEDLRHELDPGEVYVFTPRGDVYDLPTGSTVLDFAFRIHTEIGLTCKGARVNDRIVPLRTELKSGDRIEIITDKNTSPSPGWLRYIKSPRARQKLRSYFRKEEEDQDTADRAERDRDRKDNTTDEQDIQELRIRRRKTHDPKSVPIEVEGATDIPVRYAGCCSPVPGDRIVGFVTRGRGVTVHRADCGLLPKNGQERSRIMNVRWAGLTEKYPVRIEIKAKDRQGLYLDLVGGITRTFTNILKAEADIPRAANDLMKARFLIEVEHIDHLQDIIESLQSVKGVLTVERVAERK